MKDLYFFKTTITAFLVITMEGNSAYKQKMTSDIED